MKQAVAAAGLNLKVIDYKSSDPATLVAAFKQALLYNPIGVATSGLNSAVWGSQVFPLYRKAHVAIAEGLAGPQATNDVLVANLWNQNDVAVGAKVLADWVTSTSNGNGHAVVMGVPDFPILGGFAASFTNYLKAACSACSATTISETIAEVGSPQTANQPIVAAFQRDRSLNYFVTADGTLNEGIPAALSGAGLNGIKIGGEQPSLENMQDVLNGKEGAFIGENFNYYAWLLLDSILRHNEGMTIPSGDGGMPLELFTKANVGTPSYQMKAPADYQQQFEKLWHVGQ
jgi:hypothetical protein